ncbi:nicotinate-nucleotide adenylyltransferase [Scheffersomyces amazonensis]|uniref:nicotinate-nucleotide adenylyltransferase n=1 Tax=Scheffersomyces amazonensis TaxID=1078765 RepID=UPI00315DB619
MSTTRRFYKPLQDFINSTADFRIIYTIAKHPDNGNVVTSISHPNANSDHVLSPNTRRICVLDSSFNPPHLGHYTLIKESLNPHHYFQDTTPNPNEHEFVDKEDDKAIILLLSVKNADKIKPVPESFENRLEMMYLMANDLSVKFPNSKSISIGLTKHAKFVDKSISILNYLHSDDFNCNYLSPHIKLTFLVGFDTLLRIFNPKYYLPDKLSTSLEEFMTSTDLFCLTRNNDEVADLEQSKYVEDIKQGKHIDIPTHWSNNIFLINNGEKISLISSSNIRASVKSGSDDWHNKVSSEIKDFIIKEKLYR